MHDVLIFPGIPDSCINNRMYSISENAKPG